jgi:uncharacterized membrane protein
VAAIIGGIVVAAVIFVTHGVRTKHWQTAYEQLRSNLGRGILLGLELLVGADIISTITAPLTIESVGLLGGIVVIRTFLSFSLETEILGCWPWQRAAKNESDGRSEIREERAPSARLLSPDVKRLCAGMTCALPGREFAPVIVHCDILRA